MTTSRKTSLLVGILLLASATLALGQGTYTQIDYPGATLTVAAGINSAGDVVGEYQDTSGNSHGFLLSSGIYTTIDDPDAPGAYAVGINDLGQIVGTTSYVSYLYDLQSQTFTDISYPDAHDYTAVTAINNSGTVVGILTVNGKHDVDLILSGGKYRMYLPPGTNRAQLLGINNSGEAVGIASEGTTLSYNLLFTNGRFQRLRIPGHYAGAGSINDSGAIVGAYLPSLRTGYQGFLYEDGVFQEIAFPGSVTGSAQAINDSGEIVGGFYDSSGNAPRLHLDASSLLRRRSSRRQLLLTGDYTF